MTDDIILYRVVFHDGSHVTYSNITDALYQAFADSCSTYFPVNVHAERLNGESSIVTTVKAQAFA